MQNLKPFVKWVGGKTQILSDIDLLIGQSLNKNINKYAEPFVGGGAVLFHILSNYNFDEIYIGDTNQFLINTYNTIKDNVDELVKKLQYLQEKYSKSNEEQRAKIYYKTRDSFNSIPLKKDTKIDKASQFIFLNKTCFNGLFRVNSKGLFNTPKGRYKNPLICDEENLRNISKALRGIKIVCGDYVEAMSFIDKNTLVYLDPPYRPITKTSSFTAYNREQFDDDEQLRLSNFVKDIDKKGTKFILSNSDPKNYDKNDNFFDILYGDFNIKRVEAKRAINSDGNARGKITELLIYN